MIFSFFPPGPAHFCSVGHTSQRSIRSPCSALSSVALAKCQCWDLGLLILLLNAVALSGKKDWIDLWTKRCFKGGESCLNPAMSRHVPLATPLITVDIMKPKNGIGLHLRGCHSVWSVSLEFFVLSNNIYLSSEAQRGWGGWGASSRSEGVWYWWNMAGILSFFSLSLLNPFKL